MNIHEWLAAHADQISSKICGSTSQIWVTKLRGDYLTHVGMEDKLTHLVDLVNVMSTWEAGKPVNIGFNTEDGKWYGWSHRALFGFEVGSEVKRGDCAYVPIDKDDFLKDMIRFWSDDDHVNVTGEHRKDGVYVEWEISQNVPNEKARGNIIGSTCSYPDEYGKGEWRAETPADARQMAIDFANSIA